MENMRSPAEKDPLSKNSGTKKSGWLKTLGITLGAAVLAAFLAVMAIQYWIFPAAFRPVTLSVEEERVLEQKIDRLNAFQPVSPASENNRPGRGEPPEPERYSEEGSKREISFSEREFNAMIAKNTDLGDKLAIDFSGDLASLKLLVPLDPEFPVFGGRTLKVTAGIELAYLSGKPVVKLRGVSLWGVPLPNAWLGNIKNVDLVKEYGNQEGFWNSFSSGIEDIKVEDGSLRIRLKP